MFRREQPCHAQVALQVTLDKTAQLAPLVLDQHGWLVQLGHALKAPPGCSELLRAAIQETPAALVRDGGVIATGFDAELDELRAIQDNCDGFLLELEQRPGGQCEDLRGLILHMGRARSGRDLPLYLHRQDDRPGDRCGPVRR